MDSTRVPLPQIRSFCQRWQIVELSLFGSMARGEDQSGSDVDILVRFAPEAPWSSLDLATMRDELATIFGRDVDLVEEAALRNPFRRRAILRDKQVVYAA